MTPGRHGRVAALLAVFAWACLIGCGPKPKALRSEPPQPEIQAQKVETDAANKPAPGGEVAASADADAANADETPKSYLVHKVRWGHETLYSISLWYTGKGQYWQQIAAENPEIKPRRMRIGDTIRIPEALLVRHRPMPATFMSPATPQPKKPSAPKPSTASQKSDDTAPPLYGPVDQAPPLYGPVGEDAPAPAEKPDELAVPLETLDK